MSRQREMEQETRRLQRRDIGVAIATIEAVLRWHELNTGQRTTLATWSRDTRQYLRRQMRQPYKPLPRELLQIGDEIVRLLVHVCDLVDKSVELHDLRTAQAARREAGEAYRQERVEILRRMSTRKPT